LQEQVLEQLDRFEDAKEEARPSHESQTELPINDVVEDEPAQ
jgi:hypothetical protein